MSDLYRRNPRSNEGQDDYVNLSLFGVRPIIVRQNVADVITHALPAVLAAGTLTLLMHDCAKNPPSPPTYHLQGTDENLTGLRSKPEGSISTPVDSTIDDL